MKIFVRFLFLGLVGLFLCSAVLSSRFHEVIDRVKSKSLKLKLHHFKETGIEKHIDTTHYDTEIVISNAKSYLGTRHRMHGTSKKGIDCSGLVMMAHKECNIHLPHNSHEAARFGKIIPHIEELQRGDLVYFYNTYKTSYLITHSGIYLGDGKFIHSTFKNGVIITSINDPYYWKDKFLFGTRPKPSSAPAAMTNNISDSTNAE